MNRGLLVKTKAPLLRCFGGDGGNRTPQGASHHGVPASYLIPALFSTMQILAASISANEKAPLLRCFGGDGGNRRRVQNYLTKGSTGVVYRLGFPSLNGGKRPLRYGSL